MNDKNAIAIAHLSDRYDELVSKTSLNTAEQKELNEIMRVLSKTVPGATTAMDKYGQATAISTVKTREYIESKRKLYELETNRKIKQNTELLKQYESEQRILNVTEKDSNGLKLEGIGFITRKNDVLKVQNVISRQWRDLTNEELEIYLKSRIANESNIALVERNIQILRNRLSVQKEVNKENAKEVEKPKGPRTIDDIDAEIKAQEDLIGTLSDKTGKEGDAVKRKIAALKAERELIYSTAKADKDKTNTVLRNMIRTRDAIYQLSQFRYAREIEINQKIIDDDKSTLDQRLDAYSENLQMMESKNLETLKKELSDNYLAKEGLDKLGKKKLDDYMKEKDARIKLIAEGNLAVQKMTNAELLIYEKFQFEKKNIAEKAAKDAQRLIDEEVDKVDQEIERQSNLEERKVNEAIEAENIKFQALNDLESMNHADREKAIEKHEQKILDIKKKFALDALRLQIYGLEKELADNAAKEESLQISAKKREDIENRLQKAKTDLWVLSTENYNEQVKKRKDAEEEFAQQVKELSQDLTSALADLANAIFDTKVQNIDREIQKNDEYYARQIELAGNDTAQKKLLEEEAEKKRQELEKKKRKEQQKQAIFNKGLAIAQATYNLATAVTAALTAGPGVGIALSIITAAIAGAQLATILATPIPKYKDGRKGGKAEFAEVGDGYVNEVVEKKDGRIYITPNVPTLTYLEEGDKVHSSVDDFKKLQRASMLASLQMEDKKMNDYQAAQMFNYSFDQLEDKIEKGIEKGFKNAKFINNINMPKIDIAHEVWKSKNTNWS